MLHRHVRGEGSTVVLIHGFTQSASSWDRVAAALATDHRVVAVDAPGHGGSGGVAAGLADGSDQIAEAGGRGAYVGYSMGGRFALHVALRHPGLVERLVLVSTTAGIDDPAARAARRDTDEELARKVEREGVAAFVAWWLAQPLWAGLDPDVADLPGRLAGSAEGLASSLRLAGAGNQEPLWSRLGGLTLPVLVVAGARDERYVELAKRLVASLPDAELAVIAGAGHACHLERPDEWLAVVRPFLARTPA